MGDKKPRVSSSSSSSTSEFSSDDETDARDLKSIKGYLSDRRELARQLFKSVKTEKIRMMLPQILKTINLTDLEEWCASELCGMSEARILSIVNGQPMVESSDTSETDDSGPSLEIISDTEEWLTDTDVPIKKEPTSSGASKSKRSKTNKSKIKNQTGKKNDTDKTRTKTKVKVNSVSSTMSEVKIKKEKDKDNRETANKEGESLLDLLELEMRARAIRALIRKEEDVVPSAASEIRMAMTADALRNTLNSAVSASLANKKNSNGKLNLEDTTVNNDVDPTAVAKPKTPGKSSDTVEDEDVVFVVAQPTPTIELLSSDNDDEKHTSAKKDKKKDNNDSATSLGETSNARQNKIEKISVSTCVRDNSSTTTTTTSTKKGRVVTIDKTSGGPENLKISITKKFSESSMASSSPSKSGKSKKMFIDRPEKNVAAIVTNTDDRTSEKNSNDSRQLANGLFKKIKKKQHLRSKRNRNIEVDRETVVQTSAESGNVDADKTSKILGDEKSTTIATDSVDVDNKRVVGSSEVADVTVVKVEATEIQECRTIDSASKIVDREARKKSRRRPTLDEDRPDDFEEIIDLDHYSDDMSDGTDNNVDEKTSNGSIEPTRIGTTDADEKTSPNVKRVGKEKSSETWASRYYQTDDVQNVIKESKIQSEIRKRLRERQRQSKLNSSPKLNSPGDATVTTVKIEEKIEIKPTGSVQEYLALKNATVNVMENVDASVGVDKKISDGEICGSDRENRTLLAVESIGDLSTKDSTREIPNDLVSTATVEAQ